jgi:hypothetical protein
MTEMQSASRALLEPKAYFKRFGFSVAVCLVH